jgi:Protein of unknown function (DUF3617)
MLVRAALAGAVVLSAAGAYAAVVQSIAVKPGLWEMTTKVQTQGSMMPPDVYAQMPPAQRAQIEARMAQSRQPQTRRHCVTQADIDKGLQLADETRGRCTTKLVSNSRTAMVVRVSCRGRDGGTSTGVTRFTTTDGTTMDGRFTMDVTARQTNMTIKGRMSGRWLGANCGTVKPRAMQ